jgi:hypothetical protein
LCSGFETGSILQLDPASGKAVTRLTKVHGAGINRLLGIPLQPSLVAAGDMDGRLCIWDLRSQQHVLKYSKHSDYISGLTVSEKQQALLAVSGDGTLSVHDLRSCKALARSEDDADDELMSGEAAASQLLLLGFCKWCIWQLRRRLYTAIRIARSVLMRSEAGSSCIAASCCCRMLHICASGCTAARSVRAASSFLLSRRRRLTPATHSASGC